MTQPLNGRYSREQILDALTSAGSQYAAGKILGCSHVTIGRLIKYHSIQPTEWTRSRQSAFMAGEGSAWRQQVLASMDEEAQATPTNVLRGALSTAQSAIGDWSSEMGMKQNEESNLSEFDVRIILEEAQELVEAQKLEGTQRTIATLDALGDLVYVIFNVAWRRKLPLAAAVAEIHRSNCTKTPAGDGKPTKGPNYSEPDLERVLLQWDAFQEGITHGSDTGDGEYSTASDVVEEAPRSVYSARRDV
jgi:hypothetical protein